MVRILPVSSASFQTTYPTQSLMSTEVIAAPVKFTKTFLPQDFITPHSLCLSSLFTSP